jgi:PAS domain S-box-containing protein
MVGNNVTNSTLTNLPAAAIGSAFEPIASRASILMVDDQPARLLTYESILHGLQVECVGALSASEALNLLLKKEFAAILLDVEMPEMDGFELARLIREHPRLEKTPIIFVTGVHISELDRLKGYEVGAIDYIAVPVIAEILRTKVAVLVELHQRRRQLLDLNRDLQAAAARFATDAAKSVRDEAARLRVAFENPRRLSVILRAVRDASGAIIDWLYEDANTNALSLVGSTREALRGHSVGTELGEANATTSRCAQALLTKNAIDYELRLGERLLLATAYAADSDYVVVSAHDISQQRAKVQALRSSELKYRALIENTSVGIAHNALTGEFLYVNRAFCDLVGYTAEELATRTWQQITHPADVEKDLTLADKVVTREISHYTLEKRYLRKDGGTIWVELFGSFIFDDEGQISQGVAIVVDISARRNGEAALRDSREGLFLAKAAARLGTFDWEIPSDTLVWDERTHELWGIEPTGPTKVATFFSQVHPEDHRVAQRAIDQSFDPKGNHLYSALYRVTSRSDGLTRWVEATGRVSFQDDRPARMIGVVQEVTERVLAQNKLAESEQRFRELANSIDQFAWSTDAHGEALWYNDRWYDYTGTSFEQLQGDGWRTVHHPDHVDRFASHFQQCLGSGQPWEDTFPLRAKDGSYRWFLSRAVAIRDEAGSIVRWFGTNTDVTELRLLQETLKENDRRKDEFLAVLAHELRNPVAPIRNAAEVLRRLLQSQSETRLVEIIRRQTSQLAHLLDDLLDVARVTSGHIELHRETVALQSCIDAAIETAEPLIREKSQRLTVTNTLEPFFVAVDKVRVAQCIANVLVNATKFTPTSGDIRIRTYSEHGLAVIEVSDSGAGIATEFLPRVFELFTQAERTSGRSRGGLGVGLFVCKSLLSMHGGQIECRSEGVGYGSTFVIRLPLVRAADPPQKPVAQPKHGHRRVLVVDDNSDSADTLVILLQSFECDARAAYSGEEALKVAHQYDPDIVILDIGLPEMSGYEVARCLTAQGCAARLIALSGYGQEEDRARSAAAGFDAHLVKPADIAALMQIISEGLRRI